MNTDNILSNLFTFILVVVLGFVVYTDELEVNDVTSCSNYSTETGACTSRHKEYACTTEHFESVKFYCSEDLFECNKKCQELDKWYE